MSTLNAFQPRSIKLFLEGLLVIFVSSDYTECTIGLLGDVPPHHNLKIEIIKSANGGTYQPVTTLQDNDLTDQLRLEVSNTSTSGIRKREPNEQINRITGQGSFESFNWVFEFERDFYVNPIGARKGGFRSLITLNNGELFTQLISQNKLQFRQGTTGAWRDFGHVAVVTGVEITLDDPQSSAVFTNGGTLVFQSEPQTDYQINIDRGDDGTHTVMGSDADYYFTAVGPSLTPDQRLHFRSFPPLDPSLPVSPDAACLNATGQGPILP